MSRLYEHLLTDTLARLRSVCVPANRSVGDLLRNAVSWVAIRSGSRPERLSLALKPPFAPIETDRLTESAYLGAVGYLFGTDTPTRETARLTDSLVRVLARRPHTLEKSGYADDLVSAIGLLILANELKLSDESRTITATIEEDLSERPVSSPFLLVLCTLALPARITGRLPPIAITSSNSGDLAAVALLGRSLPESARRLFPTASPNLDADLAEQVCLAASEPHSDLDSMLILSTLESSRDFLNPQRNQNLPTKEFRPQMIKILFLGIEPKNTSRLRVDEEIRDIQDRLQHSSHRDQFDVRSAWAVRASDLQGHLLHHQPQILHISGHGNQTGQIILENDRGEATSVDQNALTELFRLFVPPLKCVVLNTCYSRAQAQAIAAHVDCVIGMKQAVNDKAAIVFASSFYQALGYGQSVSVAFDLGRNQISLQGLPGPDVPELLVKTGVDAKLVLLANP